MLLFFLLITFSSCGEFSLPTPQLSLKMMGVGEPPQGNHWGDYEPINQTYKLLSLHLLDDKQNLLLQDTASILKINNRSQIVFQTPIPTSWNKKTFSGMVAVFQPQIAGVSKYSSPHNLFLNETTISYLAPFEIPTGKNVSFLIKVFWGKTVDRNSETKVDQMSTPELSLEKLDS